MGCGSSMNQVAVIGSQAELKRSPTKVQRPRSKTVKVAPKPESDIVTEPKRGHRLLTRRGKQQGYGSQTSLGSMSSDGRRGTSATSKASHHSMDSGFADTEYRNVITEFSGEAKVKRVEEDFNTPRNLDLTLSGIACPKRSSAKDKERMDEQRVIASLREEGLIARPVSRAAKGMAFDIVAENAGMFSPDRRPPPRLAKLEETRKKKKKPLTEEQIQAKLIRAQERKKEREQQRLEKIQALNKSDVQNALDSFAQRQQDQEETHKTKEELAAENRERHLREMRDKLKAKQEHAEKVRKRKQLAPIQLPESPRNGPSSARSTDGRPDGLNPLGYSFNPCHD